MKKTIAFFSLLFLSSVNTKTMELNTETLLIRQYPLLSIGTASKTLYNISQFYRSYKNINSKKAQNQTINSQKDIKHNILFIQCCLSSFISFLMTLSTVAEINYPESPKTHTISSLTSVTMWGALFACLGIHHNHQK